MSNDAVAATRPSRPWFTRKRFLLPLGVVLAALLFALTSRGDATTASVTTPTSQATTEAIEAVEEVDEETPAPAEEVEDPPVAGVDLTPGQADALRAAEGYLSMMPLSRARLVEVLSADFGDGFPLEDATFAADNVGAVWREQAVQAAENYLELRPYSRSELIDQLTSDTGDRYTLEQATYAVDQAGL